MQIDRISPEEVYPRVQAGDSLLVCAYDSDESCRNLRLEGSIFLSDFKSRVGQLPKDREIIFYCA
jgi:hypothetical protein